MADFIDHQAEESENSGSSSPTITEDEDDEPKKKKSKVSKKSKKEKSKKRRIASSDEEDDDEDDEAGREEMKDFIADGEDEEPEEEEAGSEKSEERSDVDELDEDDMDLLQENLDIKGQKRGRIVRPDDSEEEDDRTAIQNTLFGFDDEERNQQEPSNREKERAIDEYSDAGSDDSETSRADDFIEYEKDEKRQKHRTKRQKELNIPEGALDEARDVFGVEDFNFDDFYDEEEEERVGEEDEEGYGEDDDLEERPVRSQRRQKEKKETLMDTLEPTELELGYLAPADKKIQLEDRPERFQLRRIPVEEADEEELNLESKWIYQMAFLNKPLSSQDDPQLACLTQAGDMERNKLEAEAPEKMKEVLKFFRNQHFEVPFIAFYRKEPIDNILDVTEMWKVYRWDAKWCHLQTRKNKLLSLLRRMQTYQVESEEASQVRNVQEADIHEVEGIQSLEQWQDCFSQFQLFYASELPKMFEWETARKKEQQEAARAEGEEEDVLAGIDMTTKFKPCTRKDKYQLCVEHGIGEMAARFGLTAKQFAENLDWKRHEVEQDPVDPRVAAEEYISTSFLNADAVINGAIFMLAKEISREPAVRARIREYYRRRICLNVRPTKQGREQMDDSHPIWKKRYIKEKPIELLEGDDFLYYHLGKQNGLLAVELVADREGEETTLLKIILEDQPFYKDEYTDVAEEWNKLRNRVIEMAVQEMLVPALEQEMYTKLLDEAKECVIKRSAFSLYTRLEVAGYRPEDEDADEEEEYGERKVEARILGIAYATDRDEVTFGALVDGDGVVLDHIRLPYLMSRSKFPHEVKQKEGDVEKLQKFIERKKPHLIAIAGENLQAKYLKNDITEICATLMSNDVLRKSPQVVIHDNEAAKVYMHSKMAEAEHPDYPTNLRQALSLARLVADPLVEYAHLANADEDLFCLPLHPLQNEVNKEDLHEALALELINRVNEVGVDINKCVELSHHANLLQFVCGLGPRKAAYLSKTIRQNNNLLESRTRLVILCKIGPKVFMNCAGFIKIDTAKVGEKTDTYVEVLDGSRVHPETYEWARKMAVDALEVEDGADPTAALEEVLQSPDKLRDLDLDAFAEELQRQGFGNKGMTLYDIRSELNSRYKDLRKPFSEPTDRDLFGMLTKETEQSLYPGKMVMVKVDRIVHRRKKEQEDGEESNPQDNAVRDDRTNTWRCGLCQKRFEIAGEVYEHLSETDPKIMCPGTPVGIRVRLDNGITGFIRNQNLSDNQSFQHPGERVQVGQSIHCRVLKVEPERFSCDLTCKSSDLRKAAVDYGEKDKFWDDGTELEDELKDQDLREKRKNQHHSNFVKRVISHPQFHNVTFKDAERMLAKLEQGDAIIRPSSKSANQLSITWKVADDIYNHIDVKEELKEKPFSLGKRLIIENEEFEDLEEILARFIRPMASFARECLNHKYAFEGVYSEQKDQIEQKLFEEKKIAPSRIPYCITPSRERIPKFTISYLTRTVRQEYMTMTHEGIRFRQQMFGSLEHTLTWFKGHYRERPPQMYGGRA